MLNSLSRCFAHPKGKTTEALARGTKQKTVQALSKARGGDFVLWGGGPGITDYDTYV